MVHESDDYDNCNECSWYSHQMISTRSRELGNNGTGGNFPKYSILGIAQNTVKSPGDTRRLAVTKTPVETHQLTLTGKPPERNRISSNSSTEQGHKDQEYQSKNRYDATKLQMKVM